MQIKVAGYALSGGGRGIERVDISVDGGKTWVEAQRYQKTNVLYASDDMNSDKWAWVLFEAVVDIPEDAEIIAKAVCLQFSLMLSVVSVLAAMFVYLLYCHSSWTG